MKIEKTTPSESIGNTRISYSIGLFTLWVWIWSLITATHFATTYIDFLSKYWH